MSPEGAAEARLLRENAIRVVDAQRSKGAIQTKSALMWSTCSWSDLKWRPPAEGLTPRDVIAWAWIADWHDCIPPKKYSSLAECLMVRHISAL